MRKQRKTHPVVKVLSLLIPILLIFLFLLIRDIAGFRIGSDTDYGAVYKIKYMGETWYHWYIFNEDGTVREDDFTDGEPYIWQDGNRISLILQRHGGNGKDWDSDMFFQNAEFCNYYLDDDEINTFPMEVPTISKNLKLKTEKVEEIESGSEYVRLYRLTVPDIVDALYGWAVYDAWGEELWSSFSITKPEVIQSGEEISLIYTARDEIQESVYLFWPREGKRSYDYHLYENGTVYVEQLMKDFNFYFIDYDNQIADRNNFVNTEPCGELHPLDEVYLRAKKEINIPYSLVTFRADYILNSEEESVDFRYWEVTFSQMDNPEGKTQIVYLTGDGKTVLILDGTPYT